MNPSPVVEIIPFSKVEKALIARRYLSWLNDRSVTRLIGSPILYRQNDLSLIDESFERFNSPICRGYFIRDTDSLDWIGTAKIDKIDSHNRSAELGIMIGEKTYWGRGIAKQVCLLLMKSAFLELGVHRLWGGTSAKNEAMRRVFTSVGFREEGVLRDACRIDGEYSDTVIYSILRPEYSEMYES